MKYLLKIKPWMLLLLILIPALIPGVNLIFRLINLFGMTLYITWLLAIGSTMWSLFSQTKKSGIFLFKISCLFILLTLITTEFIDPVKILGFGYLFWGALIFLLAVNFYILGFAAVTLESAIQGRKVGFSDSLKTFFSLWFFPIGVWYIQPMIRRALEGQPIVIDR